MRAMVLKPPATLQMVDLPVPKPGLAKFWCGCMPVPFVARTCMWLTVN